MAHKNKAGADEVRITNLTDNQREWFEVYLANMEECGCEESQTQAKQSRVTRTMVIMHRDLADNGLFEHLEMYIDGAIESLEADYLENEVPSKVRFAVRSQKRSLAAMFKKIEAARQSNPAK
jgi:hypothetical protein